MIFAFLVIVAIGVTWWSHAEGKAMPPPAPDFQHLTWTRRVPLPPAEFQNLKTSLGIRPGDRAESATEHTVTFVRAA